VRKVDPEGNTELHVACIEGSFAKVYELWSARQNLEVLNRRGDTPLHRAAATGHARLVEFLVAVGADIETRNGSGWTPLHWATFMEREKVVRQLLRDGASVAVRDRKGKTPLDIVEEVRVLVATPEVLEIERMLREAMEHKGRKVKSLKRLCVKRLMGRRQHGEMIKYLQMVYGGGEDGVDQNGGDEEVKPGGEHS